MLSFSALLLNMDNFVALIKWSTAFKALGEITPRLSYIKFRFLNDYVMTLPMACLSLTESGCASKHWTGAILPQIAQRRAFSQLLLPLTYI